MLGNQINEASFDQPAEAANFAGYDMAKLQIKTEEDSKDYDHLVHLGLNQNPHEEHDACDTYAHSQADGNDNNDTYSHA